MNNEQIIQDAAVALGLYTEEEIEDYANRVFFVSDDPQSFDSGPLFINHQVH